MLTSRITCDSYFDGETHHRQGPYTLLLRGDRIEHILPAGAVETQADVELHVPFLMPGLVEGHAHLFLDGDETDFAARSAHLKQAPEALLAAGEQSLALNHAAGITLVRDAGDKHGVNTRLRRAAGPATTPELLSAGVALRKTGRYGSFMAREAAGLDDLAQVVRELAVTADQLKILLTGIIDFETGRMKGEVQFSQPEVELICRLARELNLQTFCHCSGVDGLKVAVEAGIDCIEHGFFMTREVLAVMRDKQLAWVPTFMPVDFQWRYPEYCGWNEATCGELRRILDNHAEHLQAAYAMGVPVISGSDAGSYGAPHGRGLIEELILMSRAGAPTSGLLASATSLPRRRWGLAPGLIRAGCEANLLGLAGSPFDSVEQLREPLALYHRGWRRQPEQAPALGREEHRTALLARN